MIMKKLYTILLLVATVVSCLTPASAAEITSETTSTTVQYGVDTSYVITLPDSIHCTGNQVEGIDIGEITCLLPSTGKLNLSVTSNSYTMDDETNEYYWHLTNINDPTQTLRYRIETHLGSEEWWVSGENTFIIEAGTTGIKFECNIEVLDKPQLAGAYTDIWTWNIEITTKMHKGIMHNAVYYDPEGSDGPCAIVFWKQEHDELQLPCAMTYATFWNSNVNIEYIDTPYEIHDTWIEFLEGAYGYIDILQNGGMLESHLNYWKHYSDICPICFGWQGGNEAEKPFDIPYCRDCREDWCTRCGNYEWMNPASGLCGSCAVAVATQSNYNILCPTNPSHAYVSGGCCGVDLCCLGYGPEAYDDEYGLCILCDPEYYAR